MWRSTARTPIRERSPRLCGRSSGRPTWPGRATSSPSTRASTASAIDPPRGGESDAKRIAYQAAPGEKVEIKGSEVVKDWVKVGDGVWKVTLPNSFFGAFNPYCDLIHGDWFEPKGRAHHTGARLSRRRMAGRGGGAR
ncbi:MAG: hypothetical protein M0C28_01190 [Candidatus Moduliflexus flocculans]|nr:hypothetical protein [Candidatus Moduliflexus flocculans]